MADVPERPDMWCPRCVQQLAEASPQCEHCGFELDSLDGVFGDEAVFLDRITDPTGELRGRDRTLLGETLERFEARFPQLFVATYLGYLPQVTTIRQFGFWLMNRAAVAGVDVNRPNHHGILFVVDLQGQAVGLTLGYQVEPFLDHSGRGKVLRAGSRAFAAGDYGGGLRDCVGVLSERLAHQSRQTQRAPSAPVNDSGDSAAGLGPAGMGLVPLRFGHRFRKKPKQQAAGGSGGEPEEADARMEDTE